VIERQQLKLIKVAVRQLGLDDQTYRQLLARVAGVESSTKLSQRQFGLVLEELGRLGFKSTSPRKPFAARSRPGFATNAQVALIRRLWLEWAGAEAGYKGLDTWISKTFRVDALRFLSLDDAPGAIAALRAMNNHRSTRKPVDMLATASYE
jgi:hypothetical protein